MNLLTITTGTQGEWTVVTAAGEVDIATSPALSQAMQESIADTTRLVVDLGRVSFLDSTGLGVLVKALNACNEDGSELRLVVTDPNVLKVFEVTALDDVFSIHQSLGDAAS